MAFSDPVGNLQYWYDGVSSSFLTKFKTNYPDNLNYWYNSSTSGYLMIGAAPLQRTFAILIGF